MELTAKKQREKKHIRIKNVKILSINLVMKNYHTSEHKRITNYLR